MIFPKNISLQTPNAHIYKKRSFAAVLFRRIASKSRKTQTQQSVELFISLPTEHGYVIRQKLLEALSSETSHPIRNKIGDAVAEIARQYSDASTSPKK